MTIELTLPDMSCGHCQRAVTAAVLRVDPQAQVNVDLQTKVVAIESAQPVDAFKVTLAEEGYPAAS
jgi:copper chaperone